MPQLPTPVRAALGLVATAIDSARDLPEKAIELPMLAVSTALQVSLRAQQRYAALAVRGEELLSGGRKVGDEPPAWAQFDDPIPEVDGSPDRPHVGAPVAEMVERAARLAPNVGAAKKPATKRTAAASAPAEPATPATPAKKAPAKKAPSPARAKSVPTPRSSAPSKFDSVGDSPADGG